MHPIWSEHYDYCERQEIVEWGIDPIWLAAELERVHDGSDHCAYPILRPYPFPDRMRVYIKARFTTADGCLLEGYVINEDAYVISFFIDNEKFSFSRYFSLKERDEDQLERIKTLLPDSSGPLFPVKYETDFLDSEDRLIAGEFSPATH
ncbi:MAG: hypothetical protein KDA77_08615 [Planctomycetaceae bacterium]|nr:hypothetical protein [Planctomycetaceae bacterium]